MADLDREAKSTVNQLRSADSRTSRFSQKANLKSNRPQIPDNACLFSKSKSDLISYENLLVNQYLSELRYQRVESHSNKLQAPVSPYLQRLHSSQIQHGRRRYRPSSATVCRPCSAHGKADGRRPDFNALDQNNSKAICCCSCKTLEKPKIDARFIADPNLWDPATPRVTRFARPSSAPVKRLRPPSGNTQRFRPSSGHKSVYRIQPTVIKVLAYINGSREKCVHLAASTVKILLEVATEKLGLPFAARRIFLESGVEVFRAEDIPAENEIYISMGEPYKNPYQTTKSNFNLNSISIFKYFLGTMIVRNSSVWTLSGIMLSEKGRRKGTRIKMSKRMRELCTTQKVRMMIYKNGCSTEPSEVVVDMEDMDWFFIHCTSKLSLTRHAKIAYDWTGKQITHLSETPILDDSTVQHGKTPFFGPLWISTGEGFSPSGTQGFLLMIKNALKEKIKILKSQKKQIDFALNDEKGEVNDPIILAMASDDLYEASEKIDEQLEKFQEALMNIQEKLKALKDEALKEEEAGVSYKFSQIQEIGVDDRLLGIKGIKLKVFENGHSDGSFVYFFNLREAMKGAENRNQILLRLLDELSQSRLSSGVNRNLNAVATKLYDKNGVEIKDVSTLQQDQSVWLSFGEPYISPFIFSLHLFLDKATRITDSKKEYRIVREAIVSTDEELVKDTSKWEACAGFPDSYESKEAEIYDDSKVEYLLQGGEVDIKAHFLLLKDKHDKVLYPEIGVSEKTQTKNQIFVHTKNGYIYCKAAPQLCLTVSDNRAEVHLLNSDSPIDGYVVCMQKKVTGNPAQVWHCLQDATISSQLYPGLLLTYLGYKRWDPTEGGEQQQTNVKNGCVISMIVTDRLPKKHLGAQRFAFKQERFDNLGQWKYTATTNPEWNKLAYSWPVLANGELNEKYDWPMEGFIIPNVPPIRKSDKKLELSGATPARLKVLKNGDRKFESAVSVVGPNMTNLVKDHSKKDHKHKMKVSKNQHIMITEELDLELHCMNMTIYEVEFLMFLAYCTSLLDLPFAARRLFDYNGKELFNIQNLERDSLVYVSCGEEWSDPKLSKKEQKRRFLLSQLSSDIVKIQQYCSMRNPEHYVLEINGSLTIATGLVVNKQWTHEVEGQGEQGDSKLRKSSDIVKESFDEDQENEESDQEPRELTYHELSHMKSDDYANTLKWPWERLVNVNNSMDTDDPEANKYTDRDLYEKFKPQTTARLSRETLQKFEYEDGYISVSSNRSLVLSVSETEGRVVNVILSKRQPDNINQRWVIKENGEIRARHNQHLVLTVSMPPTSSGERPSQSFDGCPITLQPRCTNMFGKAHQKWRYDPESGNIFAFYTDQPDKEITAANRADVCTYAIVQGTDIDQPGYIVEMPSKRGEGNKQLKVCTSCARAMRGRYKVQRLQSNTSFHCAMGDANKLNIRQIGSFKVLNNKVDLSTHEADLTLAQWQKRFDELKLQTNVHSIEKEINGAKKVRTVKVMAYKNGEGRLRKGEIICGSSIKGILCQCTHRLGLTNAARRMYLEDGAIVLDVEDLISYAEENYRSEMINIVQAKRSEEQKDPEKEDESLQVQRLHSAASYEVSQQVQRSLDKLRQLESLAEEERDESLGQQEEESQQKGWNRKCELTDVKADVNNLFSYFYVYFHLSPDLDNEEAQKIKRERDELLKNMKLPPLDVILRAPIEVWVSSGKPFVSPEVVESKEENRRKKRNFRAQVCLALDIEKHVLRLMKGRRLEQMAPGTYKSTLSSKQPVVIEKHWQEPTVEEQDKHDTVHKLQSHLGEIRANQSESISSHTGIKLDSRLYQQPNMKRVRVYPNGQSLERAIYVWGGSMQEILDSATAKLSFWKQAKIVYNQNGDRILNFDDIERDQLLCVSMGKSFMQPTNEKLNIEIKASWGRARKQYGSMATDVVVDVQKNPKVDVDPFGPPLLALPIGPAPRSEELQQITSTTEKQQIISTPEHYRLSREVVTSVTMETSTKEITHISKK
ncbi:unnamed protein product [Lymnaea stagnalis]|uniref:Doublecortin domain-containing protein n=1 Tax=Lymnaea stagnalis TaxID=6523 RepID=A0AAV2I1F4_LYMST